MLPCVLVLALRLRISCAGACMWPTGPIGGDGRSSCWQRSARVSGRELAAARKETLHTLTKQIDRYISIQLERDRTQLNIYCFHIRVSWVSYLLVLTSLFSLFYIFYDIFYLMQGFFFHVLTGSKLSLTSIFLFLTQ